MGAPPGPAGCRAPGEIPDWEVSLGWSGFSTDLVFADDQAPALRQHAVSATLSRIYRGEWTIQAGAGAILGGTLEEAGESWQVHPGWTAVVQGSRQWRGPAGAVPAVSTSISVAASRTRTTLDDRERSLLATDVRAGVVASWMVARAWSPYVALRVFGGPVLWGGVQGTDRHHYNAAVGSRVELGRGLSLFADASLLGEQSLAAGGAWAW